MRKIKLIILLFSALVLVGACSQNPPTDKTNSKNKDKQIVATENNYKTEIPLKESKIKNISLSTDAYINYDDMDQGLMDIVTEYLNPKDYFYQGGQILNGDDVTELLSRNSGDHPNGLNPKAEKKPKDSPIYVNTMVEQDYYTLDDNGKKHIDTIALGFGIDTTYNYEESKSPVKISDDEIQNYITQLISNEVDSYLKNVKHQDVNVICGFFKESNDGIVPGYYYSYGYIPKDSNKLDKVELTGITYEIFPNNSSKYSHISDDISQLQSDINSYFVDYTSLIGIGEFIDDDLQKIDLNITINLYSSAEISSFVQFIIDDIDKTNQKVPELDINIASSSNEQVAIITYENGTLKTKYIY